MALWAAVLGVAGVTMWMLGDLASRGAHVLTLDFLRLDPRDAGRGGGVRSILASTGLVLGICLAVALPVGLGSALFLSDGGHGRAVRFVRRSLDVLAGTPSVVFGLFGYAVFCQAMGLGFSILSGGLTLACMILPTLTRLSEESLLAVPRATVQGAEALALSRWTTLVRLQLPIAAPGLAAALALALGRALAETAALLFTSGYVDRMPTSLLDSGRVLSIHILDLTMNVPGGDAVAAGSALLLMVLIVAINAVSWALLGSLHHGFED